MPLYNPSGNPVLTVAYQEFSAQVVISAISDVTANTVVTAPAFIADGTSSYWVEFFSWDLVTPNTAGATLVLNLYLDNVDTGRFTSYGAITAAADQNTGAVSRRKVTPAAGSRTYSIRGWRVAANCTVGAGVGGTAVEMPGYILITKAV